MMRYARTLRRSRRSASRLRAAVAVRLASGSELEREEDGAWHELEQ
jgi:hypothetical protein